MDMTLTSLSIRHVSLDMSVLLITHLLITQQVLTLRLFRNVSRISFLITSMMKTNSSTLKQSIRYLSQDTFLHGSMVLTSLDRTRLDLRMVGSEICTDQHFVKCSTRYLKRSGNVCMKQSKRTSNKSSLSTPRQLTRSPSHSKVSGIH